MGPVVLRAQFSLVSFRISFTSTYCASAAVLMEDGRWKYRQVVDIRGAQKGEMELLNRVCLSHASTSDGRDKLNTGVQRFCRHNPTTVQMVT